VTDIDHKETPVALPDAVSTVTVGGRVLHPITGAPLTGVMRVEVPALAVNDGSLIGGGAESFPFVEGVFVTPPVLPATDSSNVVPSGWSARVTILTDSGWGPTFLCPLPAAQPTTTLSIMYAQQVTVPAPGASYVPLNSVGQISGPAGPLSEDGTIPSGQIPGGSSVVPGTRAALLDPSVLTDYSGSGAITLPAGFYENFTFVCDVLIIPNSYTVVRNCRIAASGPDFGVRLDANTGLEVGRVLEFCEITSTGPALAGAGFTARFCKIVGNGDDFARLGRSHAEPTVLEDCHVSDFRPRASAHADGVQILTQPAADVIVRRCLISMNTAAGYTLPSDAGYTAAVFAAFDVAIAEDDPDPTRKGRIYIEDCRLTTEENYTLVVDDNGVIVNRCAIGSGTTGTESINNRGDVVTVVRGTGNTDLDGNPLVTAIHSDDRSDYLTVGDPRQAGVDTLGALTDVDLSGASVNQVLALAGSGKWQPTTVSGGAGGGGGAIVAATSEWITTGNISFPNTSGGWGIMQRNAGGNVELQLAASVGDWVGVGYNGLRNNSLPIDVGVVVKVAGVDTIVRWMGNGLGTAPNDGDVGWYTAGPPFIGVSSPRKFHAQSGDIDPAVGAVRFCVVCKGDGSGVLTASADDSFHWWAENLG
jgi:hypothetical protein